MWLLLMHPSAHNFTVSKVLGVSATLQLLKFAQDLNIDAVEISDCGCLGEPERELQEPTLMSVSGASIYSECRYLCLHAGLWGGHLLCL